MKDREQISFRSFCSPPSLMFLFQTPLDIGGRKRNSPEYRIRCLLSDHDDWRIGRPANQIGHYRARQPRAAGPYRSLANHHRPPRFRPTSVPSCRCRSDDARCPLSHAREPQYRRQKSCPHRARSHPRRKELRRLANEVTDHSYAVPHDPPLVISTEKILVDAYSRCWIGRREFECPLAARPHGHGPAREAVRKRRLERRQVRVMRRWSRPSKKASAYRVPTPRVWS